MKKKFELIFMAFRSIFLCVFCFIALTSEQFLDAWYYNTYKIHGRDYSWCDCSFKNLSKKARDEAFEIFDAYDDDCGCSIECDKICYKCFLKIYGEDSEGFLLNPLFDYLPSLYNECHLCLAQNFREIAKPHYAGYFHYTINGKSPFLMRQLEFSKKYPYFEAYWPETSEKAENISEVACQLFKDLMESTAFSQLRKNPELQKDFPVKSWYFGFGGTLHIRLACTCFRFSDFYQLAQMLEKFSDSKFSWEESFKIKLKLASILSQLAPLFADMYAESISLQPTEEIADEIQFMSYYFQAEENLGEFSSAKQNIIQSLQASLENVETKILDQTIPQLALGNEPDWLAADFHFLNGVFLNEALIYGEAIKAFSESIRLNPSNRDAYIERAMAYFETNEINLALKDYESAKQLTIIPPFKSEISHLMIPISYAPKNSIEFSNGLVLGTVEGATVAYQELVPSTLSCCRGILNGLWAFVCSPAEVSKDMVNATHAVGQFIYEHKAEECLQCVVPELKDLSATWDQLGDYDKGRKIGYIIGKYGIDIFLPLGIIKGVKHIRTLKKANTMCTLEGCAASPAKQAKILEESAKRAVLREQMVAESLEKGKILVRNANVPPHIMQSKHSWDKVVKLSGNLEEDWKKVLTLLEENKIFLEKYRIKPPKTFEKFARYEHEMTINGHQVKAIFNKNFEKGEMSLNDAWVIPK